MKWGLVLLLLCSAGCTRHRILFGFEQRPQAPLTLGWQQDVTTRLNDIMACLTLSQLQCVDQMEAKRKGGH